MIKIISKDGHGNGTKVIDLKTGEELSDITRIEIEPIVPDGRVIATVTFLGVELDIEAEKKEPTEYANGYAICKNCGRNFYIKAAHEMTVDGVVLKPVCGKCFTTRSNND